MIILSSILMGISQHPLGFGFLAYFALIPILSRLEYLKSYKDALKIAFYWGAIYNLITIYWIASNIGTSSIIAFITMIISVLIVTTIPVIVFCLLCMMNKRGVNIYILALIWPTVELIRSWGLLAFPWVSLSNSQIEYSNLIQNIEYVGMFGITFFIILINIMIYRLIMNRTSKDVLILIVCIIVPILSGKLIMNLHLKSNHEDEVTIRTVQPNIHLSEKRNESENIIIDRMILQSQENLNENLDLIVWPETSFTASYIAEKRIKSLLNRIDKKLISGILYFKDKENYYNSAAYFDRRDKTRMYHKIHLVPGAEYVPFSKYLNSLEFLNFGVGNFSHGDEYTLFELNGHKFATMICLESIFPQYSRNFVREGANFLIYIVNDGWYENPPEPQQHASRLIYRSIETRRPIIRCANTGISMAVNEYGNIISELDLNKKGNMDVTIYPSNKITFYVKFGDIFIYFMMLVIVLCMFKRVRYEEYV
tara:strand:+ start:161 stop:1603 length:1443 start_codon:yes stop_codon:yes gene_type:complete